jgi:superfamily II DNA or RNA helicase
MVDGFQLRENQVGLIEDFCTRVQNGKTGFLLNAMTGFGKSFCCCRMLAELGRTALIVVPRDFLVEQWVNYLTSHMKLTKSDIGIAQQDVCDFRGKKVVVGMIHSLAKDKYPEEFKRYFGVVVWDEVHVVGAETFSATVGLFSPRYRIGMSATPSRKDGMDDVFKLTIGKTVLVPTTPGSGRVLVSPKVFLRSYKTAKQHPYLSKMQDAKSRRGVLISELSGDLARNALIAVYVKRFYESGRRTLVFSDRIEQLSLLKDILIMRHGMKASSIGVFTGSTKEADRRVILKNSPIIFATYGVMSMGVDVPDLRALIFATPLSEVAQATGRILRLCEGAKEPIILDIVDAAYADCVRWAACRQKYYQDVAKATLYAVGG